MGQAQPMLGKVELPRFTSKLLSGNPLGDPDEREVLVYLPPGYEDSAQRYPLLTVLPAYAAAHRSFTNYRAFEPDFFQRYERLLEAGEVPAAIIMAPDCMTRWGGSQFLDSTAQGPYQSYIADEVVPFVDAHFRTIPERAARAVVGHSSGGFGALRLGIDRPEVFAAYGSQAGDSAFEVSIRPSFTSVAITLGRAGGVAAFIERFESRGLRGGGDFEAVMTIATCAAYAPAPEEPFPHLALPFDIDTALPIDDVWERVLSNDPLVLLERNPSALDGAALIYLDAGDRDEHGLQFGARMMAKLLDERGANVLYEEFEGGHRGTGHRFEVSLPKLFAVLAP